MATSPASARPPPTWEGQPNLPLLPLGVRDSTCCCTLNCCHELSSRRHGNLYQTSKQREGMCILEGQTGHPEINGGSGASSGRGAVSSTELNFLGPVVIQVPGLCRLPNHHFREPCAWPTKYKATPGRPDLLGMRQCVLVVPWGKAIYATVHCRAELSNPYRTYQTQASTVPSGKVWDAVTFEQAGSQVH